MLRKLLFETHQGESLDVDELEDACELAAELDFSLRSLEMFFIKRSLNISFIISSSSSDETDSCKRN